MFIPRLQLCLLSALSVSSLLAQDGTYTPPDFSDTPPVQLEIIQNNGPMGARFVKPSTTGIEIEMMDGVGSIGVGWDFMDQFQINKPLTEKLNLAFSEPDPAKRAELLKPEIEPLLPLASIKPGSTNIHDLINKYLKAVVESEDWASGYEFSQKMMLDRSPAAIVRHFYTVAENLFVNGEEEKALNLLDQLVAARPIEESRTDTLVVAQRLADERLFPAAYRLFKPLFEGAEGTEGKLIALRSAYLCLELNDEEQAAVHLREALKVEEDTNETQAAYFLVMGVQAFQNSNPELALNHLANALALAGATSSTRQASLYFNYLSYSNLEYRNTQKPGTEAYDARERKIEELQNQQTEITANVLDEMSLFFPDGAYTEVLTN